MTFRNAFTSAIRISADCAICTAKAVSTTSLLVRPKCSQRLAGAPMFSATFVVNAMTSWFSVRSSSLHRSNWKAARAFICAKSFFGTSPCRDNASLASSSICSQISSLRCSLQISRISARE